MLSASKSYDYIAEDEMDEPHKISSYHVRPMATTVRRTPSETNQAAKKIEEREAAIINPIESSKDLSYVFEPHDQLHCNKMDEPHKISSYHVRPMATTVRRTPSETNQAAKKIEEREASIINPIESSKDLSYVFEPHDQLHRNKMDEPHKISSYHVRPMATTVRRTPSETNQAAKKIEEREASIINPIESSKDLSYVFEPHDQLHRNKMDEPHKISSYHVRPMATTVRRTPSETNQAAKKIEEREAVIINPIESSKDLSYVFEPHDQLHCNKMDEPREISSYRFRPMSTTVRITPSESDQAAKKIEEREATITNPSEEHKLDINDLPWIKTVRAKINSVHPQPHPCRPCTIFRVPENIRRGNSTAYEPLVVSIGPYHNRRTQQGTFVAMQDHKWKCVRHLLSRHRSQEKATDLLDRCLSELKALDCEVRSSYSTKLNLDQHKLASLMLLDGCFIIHTLLKQVQNGNETVVTVEERRGEKVKGNWEEEQPVDLDIGDEEEEIEAPVTGMLWIYNLIVYDLLKLENQIPFFIIQILFDILKTPADLGVDLANLALILFRDIHPNKSGIFTELPRKEFHHLLHLFHSTLIPSEPSAQPVHVTSSPEWIPCASELKLGGIKFKKNEAAQSFLDVSFKDGLMEIPPIRIYDYTPALFRNLIAFEQCYPDTRTYVTIYAAFMDCIVDTADDVHLLGLEGILVNRLGTDEAVANLFNQLCDQIHYASNRNYLEDVFVRVTDYHDSKWHQWRAGLIRDYFSNPWAGIAVVAAVVLFLLTIEQSWLAALSYLYPP